MSASLTLTYDQQLSRVRASAAGLVDAAEYTLQRSTDQVRWTTVRGGQSRRPAGGVLGVDDYEFSADVTNHYRVTASGTTVAEGHRTDNANPLLEADASSWSAIGGTVARSTAQAHEGLASLLLTPDGVTGTVEARSENVPAVAGGSMQATAWVRCAVSRNVNININWRNAGGSLLSTSTSTVAVAANTWTPLSLVAAGPAGTTQAQLVVSMAGTPPASHLLWIDEARIGGEGITPVLDKVWLKSVARPFLNRSIRVRDYSEFTRPARSGVFEVVGRSFPIAVTDVRSSKRFRLEVYAEDAADARGLDLVLASGDILFIHAPTTGRLSTVPSCYVSVGDTTEQVLPTHDLALRVFSLPCTVVAAPGPEVVGVTYTWQSLVSDFATWADVVAAFSTWAELLDNVGSPEDVIVQ